MKKKLRLLAILAIIMTIIISYQLGLFDYIALDRVTDLTDFIENFGVLAPIIFIMAYILATILFLPGLPLTVLAGIVFGPIAGTIYVSIASITGAGMAFIIARYIGRDAMIKRFSKNEVFKKIDVGVLNQGWKMVAITRLVPLFPFNVQNYIYGLTGIPFITYILVSWVCMLPATVAYVFLAGSIVGGDGSGTKTIMYLGIGVALIILLSVLAKVLDKSKE